MKKKYFIVKKDIYTGKETILQDSNGPFYYKKDQAYEVLKGIQEVSKCIDEKGNDVIKTVFWVDWEIVK